MASRFAVTPCSNHARIRPKNPEPAAFCRVLVLFLDSPLLKPEQFLDRDVELRGEFQLGFETRVVPTSLDGVDDLSQTDVWGEAPLCQVTCLAVLADGVV